MFGVAEFVPVLNSYIEKYGAQLKFNSNLIHVDGANQIATFQVTDAEGKITEVEIALTEDDLGDKIISAEAFACVSEIKNATIIVSGGRGLKTKDCFDKYIQPLTEHFGKHFGELAMPGGSRLAVEAGFIERSHQVGQTGQTVKPKIYVAVGISGAVQHLTGMQSSDIIIAINKDPNARIFKVADFGVVGDLEEVIPELMKALNSHEVQ